MIAHTSQQWGYRLHGQYGHGKHSWTRSLEGITWRCLPDSCELIPTGTLKKPLQVEHRALPSHHGPQPARELRQPRTARRLGPALGQEYRTPRPSPIRRVRLPSYSIVRSRVATPSLRTIAKDAGRRAPASWMRTGAIRLGLERIISVWSSLRLMQPPRIIL